MTNRKPVVLCIADEQLSLSVRGLVLQSEGYDVLSASTAEDALRLMVAHRPDVVICEQPSGKTAPRFDLTASLKQQGPDTPILLVRGAMEPPPQTASVDAIMTKIDGPEALLRNVAALLDHSPSNQDTQAA